MLCTMGACLGINGHAANWVLFQSTYVAGVSIAMRSYIGFGHPMFPAVLPDDICKLLIAEAEIELNGDSK